MGNIASAACCYHTWGLQAFMTRQSAHNHARTSEELPSMATPPPKSSALAAVTLLVDTWAAAPADR